MTNPSSARPRRPSPAEDRSDSETRGGCVMRAPARIAVLAVLAVTGGFLLLWATSGGGRNAAQAQAQSVSPATTRVYYIAADEVNWDYAPAGRNVIAGRPF